MMLDEILKISPYFTDLLQIRVKKKQRLQGNTDVYAQNHLNFWLFNSAALSPAI